MNANRFAGWSAAIVLAGAIFLIAPFVWGISPTGRPFLPPWSAVAFLLCGLSLWLHQRRSRSYRLLAAVSSFSVFLIGSVTWTEYLFNTNPGVDRLLFPSLLLATAPHPGRPAPVTCFILVLLGLALLLLHSGRKPGVLAREACAVAAISMCYFAFAEQLLYSPSKIQEIPFPTAAILALITASATIASGRNGQLLPLLRDPGPAGLFARRLMPVPLVVPVLMGFPRSAAARWHWYGAGADTVVLYFLESMAAIGIAWLSCNRVLRIDRARLRAEDEVRKSRDDLDDRVRLRTRELLDANQRLEAEIASHRQAQSELEQAHAMLASIIEACPLAMSALNPDGSIRMANGLANSLLMPLNRELEALVERAGSSEASAAIEVRRAVDGKDLTLSVWAAPVLTHDGGVDGVILMAADVSDRRALELQVQQTQKLESLGLLAGGIAHDFNNLLTGILGNASLLQESLPEDSVEADAARSLLDAGERMAKLSGQMLAYSGRGRFVVERVDLSRQVAQITSLIQASIPKNVELQLQLSSDLPAIEADASQLQQVIMNLVINGAESIGASEGSVEVTTRLEQLKTAQIPSAGGRQPAAPGAYVVLGVRDTGCGMDEETQARIFDPFFTTKFTGRGLGLSAVQGIVRAHQGALTVESQPGTGSHFRVFFPATTHPVPSPMQGRPAVSRGSGTVLVIDDGEVIRRTAKLALERAGYKVVTASDGYEGLALYESLAGGVSLVLLDMTMPMMSGEETLRRLHARWPQAVVIASSGYDQQEAQRRFGRGIAQFLQKPYTAAQLTEKIAQVLQAPAAHS